MKLSQSAAANAYLRRAGDLPVMKVVCGWCGLDMGEKPGPAGQVSHGICPTCIEKFEAEAVGA